eukprot:989839-Pyramimonas_sp.AAC.1
MDVSSPSRPKVGVHWRPDLADIRYATPRRSQIFRLSTVTSQQQRALAMSGFNVESSISGCVLFAQ